MIVIDIIGKTISLIGIIFLIVITVILSFIKNLSLIVTYILLLPFKKGMEKNEKENKEREP